MRLYLASFLLILLGSCEGPPKIIPDPGDSDAAPQLNLGAFHKEFLASAFDRPQVDSSVVYVCHPQGAVLYANDAYPVSLRRLNPGDTLYVISASGKYHRDETDNSMGTFWKVETTDGTPGEIWSAYVIPFYYPRPMEFENLSDYAMESFHLVDSVEVWGDGEASVDHPSRCGLNKLVYHFEQGITMTAEQTCEDYRRESIFLPGISIDQAFFFFEALGFVAIYKTFEGKIPTFEKPNGEHTFGNSVTTGSSHVMADGGVLSIHLERPADMTFDLELKDKGVEISFTAGVPC